MVEKIAETTSRPLKSHDRRQGVPQVARSPRSFADATFGVPTVTDILAELEKPGRDPRPEFKTATFKDGVEKITDLKPGMQLEGVVTNVDGVRRLRRRRRAPGRPGAHLASWPTAS